MTSVCLNVQVVSVAAALYASTQKIVPKQQTKNGRFCNMSATSNEYAQLFGNIIDSNKVSMAKCACVKCNSCTCACSCARCKHAPDKEDIEW